MKRAKNHSNAAVYLVINSDTRTSSEVDAMRPSFELDENDGSTSGGSYGCFGYVFSVGGTQRPTL